MKKLIKKLKPILLAFCFSIFFFPLLYFAIFKLSPNNFYFQEYFSESLSIRINKEKHSNSYYPEIYDFVNETLEKESDSILYIRYLPGNFRLKYLDSINLYNERYNQKLNFEEYIGLFKNSGGAISGGGSFPDPREGITLTLYKKKNRFKIHYVGKTIGNYLKDYKKGYNDFENRRQSTIKEIGFIDFWLTSVSLFKFGEIIPNSVLTKILWLIHSSYTFIFLIYVSNLIPRIKLK